MLKAEYYAALLSAVQEGTVQAVQKAASEIFQSAVSVTDASFRVLSADIDPGCRSDMLSGISDENKYVSYDLIKMFRENDLIHRFVNEPHKTILVNWGWFKDHPHLTTGIYHKDMILGHVTVLIESETYEDWQDEALQTVADALSSIMHREHLYKTKIVEEKELLARELFTGVLNGQQLATATENGFIKSGKTYQVLATNYMPNPVTDRIFPKDCLSFVENNQFLILLPKDSQHTYEGLLEQISDTGYHYGLSAEFINLTMTRSAAIQAQSILNYGLHSDNSQAGWHFLGHALDLILADCPNMYHFVHPGVYILQEYDLSNNTNYLETLLCYLENRMDSSVITKKMHIHRNSLYYRLDKIQEIMQVDLKDMNTLVHLYLSIRYIL